MKYKITIEKIETKTVKEKNWVLVGPHKDKNGDMQDYDYKTEEKEREVSEDIYQQTREENIDLMAVIKAFNGYIEL